MNKVIIIVLSVFIVACSSTDKSYSNYQYNLMKNGQVISQHTNLKDCEGASIRKNIRTVNDINSKTKTYQMITREEASNITAICAKI